MYYRVKDLQYWGYLSDISDTPTLFGSKEEVIKALADYHNSDFSGVRDDDTPYENIFEFLATLKNEQERLEFLLEHGQWELEEVDIFIAEEKIKGYDDSFWYNGFIAEYKNAKLYALGEIKVAGKYPTTEDELDKLYELGKIENNNWFEILYTDKDGYEHSRVCGSGYEGSLAELIDVGNGEV